MDDLARKAERTLGYKQEELACLHLAQGPIWRSIQSLDEEGMRAIETVGMCWLRSTCTLFVQDAGPESRPRF